MKNQNIQEYWNREGAPKYQGEITSLLTDYNVISNYSVTDFLNYCEFLAEVCVENNYNNVYELPVDKDHSLPGGIYNLSKEKNFCPPSKYIYDFTLDHNDTEEIINEFIKILKERA